MVEVSHSISDTDPMYIADSITKFRKANKNTQYTNTKKTWGRLFRKMWNEARINNLFIPDNLKKEGNGFKEYQMSVTKL